MVDYCCRIAYQAKYSVHKRKHVLLVCLVALFQAIDEQSLERCRDILQSAQIDVNRCVSV
jgi:hypothetical protein